MSGFLGTNFRLRDTDDVESPALVARLKAELRAGEKAFAYSTRYAGDDCDVEALWLPGSQTILLARGQGPVTSIRNASPDFGSTLFACLQALQEKQLSRADVFGTAPAAHGTSLRAQRIAELSAAAPKVSFDLVGTIPAPVVNVKVEPPSITVEPAPVTVVPSKPREITFKRHPASGELMGAEVEGG